MKEDTEGKTQRTQEQKEEFLRKAIERYKILYDAEYDNKESYKKNIRFAFNVGSGHWDSDTIDERDKEGRPHLTANKLAKFVNQVANSELETTTPEDVIPVDDKGDPLIARIYNDLCEDIEYRSNAQDVYADAGRNAIAGGFGYWRIITERESGSFDQIIKIKPIANPLSVNLDPKGMFCFIREVMTEEEFKDKYPKVDPVDFESDGNDLWYEQDKVYIAEYFVKEPCTKIIAEVYDPAKVESEIYELGETEKEAEVTRADFEKRGLKIMREREDETYKVKWYKICANEILDEKEWAGSEIPVIEVVGQYINLDGKIIKKSLISDATDMNKMYNYWLTALTEKVALAPKAPYLATPQQVKGFETMWEEANIKNRSILFYNATSQGKPERAMPIAVDAGAMTMLGIADGNIRDILGLYEASMGQQSNERSGKAIMARAARGDLGTLAFHDNLRRARVASKKILIDLIPKIYDSTRVVRLRNKEESIEINKPVLDGTIVRFKNDLSVGKYDIRVKQNATPSRRQQTAQTILEAMQYSQTMPIIHAKLLQLLFKYVDAEGSEEIAQLLNSPQAMQQPQPNQAKLPDMGAGMPTGLPI